MPNYCFMCQKSAVALPPSVSDFGKTPRGVVSQSVPHLHVHVVPRTKGDGLRGFFWPRRRYAEGEREAYATLLREALAG